MLQFQLCPLDVTNIAMTMQVAVPEGKKNNQKTETVMGRMLIQLTYLHTNKNENL